MGSQRPEDLLDRVKDQKLAALCAAAGGFPALKLKDRPRPDLQNPTRDAFIPRRDGYA